MVNNWTQKMWPRKAKTQAQILKCPINININTKYAVSMYSGTHSCMPTPLAPDPIRVQPCVWCLF